MPSCKSFNNTVRIAGFPSGETVPTNIAVGSFTSASISISFVWHELERQIHIEGIAAKVSPQESDEYFRKRPYKSRIGARISPQSEPIESRIQLIRDFVKETTRWIGKEIDRPEYWGGFAVMPVRVEFWQGRVNRLHDRFLYMLQSDGVWKIERLAP